MLYDPKWEQQTKADPLSLESLIAWLEKQPADGEYDYTDPLNCLMCQYFSAQGLSVRDAGPRDVALTDGNVIYIPSTFYNVANGDDRSMGGALARARDLLLRSGPL